VLKQQKYFFLKNRKVSFVMLLPFDATLKDLARDHARGFVSMFDQPTTEEDFAALGGQRRRRPPDLARGDRIRRSIQTLQLNEAPGERCNWLTTTRSAPLMINDPRSEIMGNSPM
jgi:hypothetical protein